MTPTRDEVQRMLPVQATTLHILLALAEGERHGYAIIQGVALTTHGEVRLGAGTLYRSLHRMLEQGLVVESSPRSAAAIHDDRRRYYRLTAFGRAVVRAELRRLAELVDLGRARGLTPEHS